MLGKVLTYIVLSNALTNIGALESFKANKTVRHIALANNLVNAAKAKDSAVVVVVLPDHPATNNTIAISGAGKSMQLATSVGTLMRRAQDKVPQTATTSSQNDHRDEHTAAALSQSLLDTTSSTDDQELASISKEVQELRDVIHKGVREEYGPRTMSFPRPKNIHTGFTREERKELGRDPDGRDLAPTIGGAVFENGKGSGKPKYLPSIASQKFSDWKKERVDKKHKRHLALLPKKATKDANKGAKAKKEVHKDVKDSKEQHKGALANAKKMVHHSKTHHKEPDHLKLPYVDSKRETLKSHQHIEKKDHLHHASGKLRFGSHKEKPEDPLDTGLVEIDTEDEVPLKSSSAQHHKPQLQHHVGGHGHEYHPMDRDEEVLAGPDM